MNATHSMAVQRTRVRQRLATQLLREEGTLISLDIPDAMFARYFDESDTSGLNLLTLTPLPLLEAYGPQELPLADDASQHQAYPTYPQPFFLGACDVDRLYVPPSVSPLWGQSHTPVAVRIRSPQTALGGLRRVAHIHCNDTSVADWMPDCSHLLTRCQPSLDFTPEALRHPATRQTICLLLREHNYALLHSGTGQHLETDELATALDEGWDVLAFPAERPVPELWLADDHSVARPMQHGTSWVSTVLPAPKQPVVSRHLTARDIPILPAYDAETEDWQTFWRWTGPHSKAQALIGLPACGEWEISVKYHLHDGCSAIFPIALDGHPLTVCTQDDHGICATGRLHTQRDFCVLTVTSPTCLIKPPRYLRVCLFAITIRPLREKPHAPHPCDQP